MNNSLRIIITIFALTTMPWNEICSQPVQLWQLKSDGIVQWQYVEGDEFNDKELDTERWRKSYPWGRNLGGNMLQLYVDENTYLRDGILMMEARKKDTLAKGVDYWEDDRKMNDGRNNKRIFNHTSGMVVSHKKYYKGYFEARVKNSAGNGYFPAFWLFGAHPNEEIDIMEAKGERPEQYHIDMHCASGCSNYWKFLWFKRRGYGEWVDAGVDLTQDFHNYAGEWTDGEMVFYLDDKETGQWAGELKQPAVVILNLGVKGGTGTSTFDGPIDDTTPFPQTFEADYVRIYEKVESGVSTPTRSKRKRKKKKRNAQMGDRVKLAARIYQENDKLRIEMNGPMDIPAEFWINESDQAEAGTALERDRDGHFYFELRDTTPEEFYLHGKLGDHKGRILIGRK